MWYSSIRRCSTLALQHTRATLLLLLLLVLMLLTEAVHSLASPAQQEQQHAKARGPAQQQVKPLLDLTDYAGSPLPQRVILDMDGGVDDFITLALLLSQPSKVEVLGVIIIDGDTIADVAVNTTIKLMHLLGRHDIPVALSSLQAVNPFPSQYRAHVLSIDVLPILNQHKPADIAALRERQLVAKPGQEWLGELLLQQQDDAPVTVISTGPLSNLAYALDKFPDTADKISRVWWMGGALRVPGNVYNQAGSDSSAEWNSYWDPAAVGVVLNSSVPLTLVPLDGTDKVPITLDLLYSFGPQSQYFFSALVGTLWAPVVTWIFASPHDPYCAWDTLTAACMLDGSELCEIEHGLPVAVVLSGPSQGATVLVTELLQPGQNEQALLRPQRRSLQRRTVKTGPLSVVKRVSAVVDVDPKEFRRYLLTSFRQ